MLARLLDEQFEDSSWVRFIIEVLCVRWRSCGSLYVVEDLVKHLLLCAGDAGLALFRGGARSLPGLLRQEGLGSLFALSEGCRIFIVSGCFAGA